MLLRLLLLISCFYLCKTAKAQNYYEEDIHTFHAALVSGPNFTQVDGDNYYGYDKTGMNVGAGLYMMLSENMGVNMELLYVQKGSKGKPLQTVDIVVRKYSIDLNYAEIPLQLYYFDSHKHHFGGGFSYARLINSKEVLESDPVQDINDEKYPFRKSDINLLLSGNFHLWKGLFVGARFQYSLLPVRKNNTPPNLGRSEQYNDVWNFRVEYMF